MNEQQIKPEDLTEEQRKLQYQKIMAVREATFEVMSEQKDEVVKRARAKLVAMGVTLSEDDSL